MQNHFLATNTLELLKEHKPAPNIKCQMAAQWSTGLSPVYSAAIWPTQVEYEYVSVI